MRWLEKGRHLTPLFGTVFPAATGANTELLLSPVLEGGEMWFLITLNNGSDSSVEFEIQQRNASGSGNVKVMRFTVAANAAAQLDVMFNLSEDERLRVVNIDAIGANGTGQVCAFGGWM